MADEKKHTYVNTITPVFATGKYEYPNAGTVKPVRIYESHYYVEKKNVDNVEVYKAYRALMDVCFDRGVAKKVKQADLDKAMADFKTALEKEVGLSKEKEKKGETPAPKTEETTTSEVRG